MLILGLILIALESRAENQSLNLASLDQMETLSTDIKHLSSQLQILFYPRQEESIPMLELESSMMKMENLVMQLENQISTLPPPAP